MKTKALILLCLCSCAATADLSSELYQRLNREDRAAIYERENEVTIAQSRRDEAKIFQARTKQRVKELDEQWDRCKERLEKQNQAGRIDGAKKLLETHEAFLDEQLKIAAAHLEWRTLEIDTAKARLELQKQRQLVKSGHARETTLESFEQRVREAEREAREGEKKELDLRAESQKKFLEWKAAENEYAKASGDWDSLVWVD
ncbi:MAG: hypothetical protein IT381_16705 [Deltaproteobacteria bacterium]|nr:hypothetical protein [Deltaproteobacteria bacterium]